MTMQILDLKEYSHFASKDRQKWSSSTLQEVGECPKRYMLRRGTYPSLWSRSGFPNKASTAQIRGIIVHTLVSRIVNFVKSSPEPPIQAALGFLREHGGYIELLKMTMESELKKLQGNPRSELLVDFIRNELLDEVSALRNQTQFFVNQSLTKFRDHGISAPQLEPHTQGTRQNVGEVNSEFHIEDSIYPIEGYLDFLVLGVDQDHILDFKTSKEIHAEYWEQLELYAWLWSRSNLNKLPKACDLSIISGLGRTETRRLSAQEISEMESRIQAKIASSDKLINELEPRAIPSPENCKFCSVKVLCEEYWQSVESSATNKSEAWIDVRVKVTEDLGGGNWKVSITSSSAQALLLLGGRDYGSINVGDGLSLMGVFKKVSEDADTVIRPSHLSEIFRYSVLTGI